MPERSVPSPAGIEPGAPDRARTGGRPHWTTLVAFALLVLVGGANSVGVRFVVAELPPFGGAALRLGAAALIFWLIVAVRRSPLPRGRALVGVLAYGVLNFAAAYALIFWGLRSVPAGLGQVTLSLTPLLTVFLAAMHGRERLRGRGVAGALVAIGGIAIAFGQQPGTAVPLAGLLAIAAAAACFAEAIVLISFFPRTDPFATNAVAMSTALLLLTVLSMVAGEAWIVPQRPATWLALAYVVLLGTVLLFSLSLLVIRRWTPPAASYALVLMPFVTVVVATSLAAEPATPGFVAGMVIAIAGVWLGTWARSGARV